MTDISIIIVNYNTADLIGLCLQSILQQADVSYEIIVIDNASSDNSLQYLKTFGDKITLIENPENAGFGKANNIAAKIAQGQYLYLLNPDTQLQNKTDLKNIFQFMKNNPQYGLVGTGIIKNTTLKESTPKKHYPGEKYIKNQYKNLPGNVAWVIGASTVIPKTIFETIHGFDEDYFLYGEDADICLRIRKAGCEIGCFPEVKIRHVDGGSERQTSWYDLTMKKRKGLYTFYKKHYNTDDIKSLLKRDLNRAKYRKLLYKLHLLINHNPSLQAKYEKCKAIYDSSKKLLEQI